MLINWSMGETCQLFEVEWQDYYLLQSTTTSKYWILLGSSLIYQSEELTTLSKIYSYVATFVTLLAGILLLILFILDTRINWMSIFFSIRIFLDILAYSDSKKIEKLLGLCRYSGISNFYCLLCRIPDLSIGILTEVLQGTFIVICGVILWKNRCIGDKICEFDNAFLKGNS